MQRNRNLNLKTATGINRRKLSINPAMSDAIPISMTFDNEKSQKDQKDLKSIIKEPPSTF